MLNLPQQLQENLLSNQLHDITSWWEELEAEEQEVIAILYDEKPLDEGFSIELCADFIDEDEDIENEIWTVGGLYQYLVNHEIYLKDFSLHVGGICSAHKEAIRVGKSGIIPAGFQCPLKDSDCPMKKLLELKPQHTLKLYPKRFKKPLIDA